MLFSAVETYTHTHPSPPSPARVTGKLTVTNGSGRLLRGVVWPSGTRALSEACSPGKAGSLAA